MFSKIKLKDYVNLSPDLFEGDLNGSIKEQLIRNYSDKTTEDLGLILSIVSVDNIEDGFKLPENSSRHYVVEFTVIAYKPDLHEVVEGEVSSVTNFGVFVNLGIIDGLVHLSQTMTDQVSFSKTPMIQGSQTGQSLKAGDFVRASVVAVSFKDIRNVKVGLTMRQPGLGALDWVKAEKEKTNKQAEQALAKENKAAAKKKGKKQMAIKEKACLNCKAIYFGDKCTNCGETPATETFKDSFFKALE